MIVIVFTSYTHKIDATTSSCKYHLYLTICVYYLQKSTVDFSQSLLDEMESMFRSLDGERREDTVNIAFSLYLNSFIGVLNNNKKF